MVEWLGIAAKIPDVEDALGSGEVVLLEVVIETCPRTPKIRNSSSYTE